MRACLPSCFSCFRLFATLQTIARQAPLSLGCSRQEHWSGFPFPPPRDLPELGLKPASLTSPAWAGRFFTTSTTWTSGPLQIGKVPSAFLDDLRHHFFFFFPQELSPKAPCLSVLLPLFQYLGSTVYLPVFLLEAEAWASFNSKFPHSLPDCIAQNKPLGVTSCCMNTFTHNLQIVCKMGS